MLVILISLLSLYLPFLGTSVACLFLNYLQLAIIFRSTLDLLLFYLYTFQLQNSSCSQNPTSTNMSLCASIKLFNLVLQMNSFLLVCLQQLHYIGFSRTLCQDMTILLLMVFLRCLLSHLQTISKDSFSLHIACFHSYLVIQC